MRIGDARGRWLVLALLGGGVFARGAAAPPGGPPSVRVLSSLATARLRGTPGGTGTARLEAAHGEWESFQAVVHAGARPLAALTIRAQPISGPGGALLLARVHRVGFVPVTTPSNTEGATGAWPDPLVPEVDAFDGERRRAFPVNVAAGDDATAWIDVFVPRTVPAGAYRGSLLVADGATRIAQVPIEVTVHRFALPPTSSLPVTFGFYATTAGRAHFGRAPTFEEAQLLARRYGLAALRDRISIHGGTVEPAPFSVGAGDDMHVDFAPYDAEVGPFLDGTADPGGPAEGARWTAFDLRVPWRLEGARRASYLKAMEQHLGARGWLDRVFDYTADEPTEAHLASVRLRAASVRAAAPRVARLVTRPPIESLLGAVDIWCPIVNMVDERPGTPPLGVAGILPHGIAERRARGERVWWYQACLSHGCDIVGSGWFTGWPSLVVDGPAVGQRIFEWLSFAGGIEGELYYNTVEAYDGDPWRDLRRHGGNGDGTLFYPGRPDVIGGTTHIPIESIRIKRIRDGLEDYEYLALLARLGGAGTAARIARRVADRAWRWDHDPEHLLAARAEIARRIDELIARQPSK